MNNHIRPCEVEDVKGIVATLNATDDIESCRNGNILTSAYTLQETTAKQDKISSMSSPYTRGSPDQMTEREVTMALFGLLYLAATLTLSVYYLTLLYSSMTNDLWWPYFNVSANQSYLIDVYNAQLVLTRNASTTLDLTSSAFGISKDYSRCNTPILVTPVYPRIVVDALSQDLATVIQGLLQIWGPHQLNLQYCWVDFNRTWEVAHTDKRQQRCYDRYLDNAAVYCESICRVIDWDYFITGTFGGMFNQSIGNTLKKSPEGRNWLKTTPYAFVDVGSEVAYWQRAGIRRYVPQYTNGITLGLRETLVVRNAFGAVQTISLKRMQYYHRGYFWTTMWMYWGPWGDISYASQVLAPR
ncbi:hypothetical protein AC1031_014096 [Aphanomyces cochlioides]|nr:hypothetical protein AC1031_014096 [Aphanomyces cochlioides]